MIPWILIAMTLLIAIFLSKWLFLENNVLFHTSSTPQSLIELKETPLTPATHSMGPYRVASSGVYYFDEISQSERVIENADPATFELVLSEEYNDPQKPTFPIPYAKDRAHVYVHDTLIPDANPATFRFLTPGRQYSTDSDSVFLYMFGDGVGIVPNADPATFIVLREAGYNPCTSGVYAKDAQHVYAGTKAILNADPNTFVYLGLGYGKDAHTVYLKESPIPDANPLTFEPPTCEEATKGYL